VRSPEGCTLFFFASVVEASGWASGVAVLAAQALDALEEDFLQSLAMCPAFPQNIHSLRSKWCLRSSDVRCPSFPSLLNKSDWGFGLGVKCFPL
jgi:hypothetical protein